MIFHRRKEYYQIKYNQHKFSIDCELNVYTLIIEKIYNPLFYLNETYR